MITHRDARILSHLTDLSVIQHDSTRRPHDFTLQFTFSPNPYFDDLCLAKSYTRCDADGRVVSRHDISWTREFHKTIGTKHTHDTSLQDDYGFFHWISTDDRDSSHLGQLIKDDVYPHAIQLYFDSYFTKLDHNEHI